MKIRITDLKHVATLVALMFCLTGQSWANNTTYYARVTATAIGPTGAGTVYAHSTNGADGATGTTSTAVGTSTTSGANVSFEFTATPTNTNYEFVKWVNTNNINAEQASTNNPYTRNYAVATQAGDNNARTYNIYAVFAEKEIFYFSATATASPAAGGTASVSPATANAREASLNDDYATTTAFTFTATPNENYEFRCWSSTTNPANQVSTNNPYNPTLTSTSKNSGSPTNTTRYAIFEERQVYYFSATATASPAAAGTVTVSPASASAREEHWNTNQATTTATYSVTATNPGYRFLCWSTTTDAGGSVSTNPTYVHTLESTSTSSGSPTNTTLYAVFEVLPVFDFSATATANPAAGGTASVTLDDTRVYGATASATSASTSATFTATPNANYDFVCWSTTTDPANSVSTLATYEPTLTNTTPGSTLATNLHAIFRELEMYYFSATASVGPVAGGTASVVPTSTSAREAHWDDNQATTTATYTAATNTGYRFVCWSTTTDAGGSVSTNNPYVHTLTSTSTNSGSPTNTRLYAIFEALPHFYFAANPVATPAAGGTVTAVPSATDVYGATADATSATTTVSFRVTATNPGYHFLCWSTTTSPANQVSTNTTYVRTVTSTSTNSESPSTTTLYAIFQAYPTAVTATPASLAVCEGGSNTFTFSLTPASAYSNVVATSANEGVATVSVDGNTVTVNGVAANADPVNVTVTARDEADNALVSTTVAVSVQDYVATPEIDYNAVTDKIEITCSTPGASIHYTTNGNDPTAMSTAYPDGGFAHHSAAPVKAIAVKSGMCNSAVATYNLVTPSAPVITFNAEDNTITITTETPGADIYYTHGAAPATPTSSSTLYSTTFTMPESPTVIKAIAILNGVGSSVTTSATFTGKVRTPVIDATDPSAVVLTCADAGSTILYTLDGSTPNPAEVDGSYPTKTYNPAAKPALSNPQTIKVVATKTGYTNSDEAFYTYVAQGTDGTNVVLDDREDHSWSYYSDASTPAQLHSLSPADVKITYYGDGVMMTNNNNYTAGTTDTILPGNPNYKVGAHVNVGGENENTFIYYKTLERGANTDDPWTFSSGNQSSAASRCLYKPIPNPFQVRPRYGDRGSTDANDFTGWRGFQCWRLKKVTGGAVYSAASGGSALAVGAVINAETEIYFAPNAEYGMEVELEAVWARAYVKKANQANENPVGTNNVGYERNFCVPTTGAGYTLYTGNGKRITNANHIPVTISCYYPDGTAPDNTANSISNTATSLTGDTKFENITISLTSNTLTLANYDIIVGRGCNGTINNLQGIDGNATDLDYTIRLESGTYNQFCFIRNGGATVSGRYLVKAIMGSDYDRATGTNNKLIVSPNSTLFFAQGAGFTGSSNKDQKTFDCVFKSGRYQSEQWNGTIQSGQNGYQHIAYLGQNSAQGNTYPGVRYVTVEGGEFSGMCGGRGVGSNSNNAMTPGVITFDLRIKGGTFHGAVYGGAADNPSIGSRRFIITGGEIQSWIAGGCNGTGSTNGTGATDGDSYIYVGGTTLVGGDNTIVINETNAGQVFGAGRGISGRASSVNHSHVAIADEAVIRNGNNNGSYPVGGNVYGGSYNGTIATESNVYILGGSVERSVFGGSYGNTTAAIPVANVTVTGGLVANGVYGGSNNTGNVNAVNMYINGGTVGDAGAGDGVFGGGLGSATRIIGSVNLTVGANVGDEGVTVNGDVYGGSAQGKTNCNAGGTARTANAVTNVTLNAGTINGSLYGGGLGDNSNAADVWGPVAVKVYGGTVNTTSANGSGAVYGCNNINGAPRNTVAVDIYGTDPAPSALTYALDAVYGGGNQASYAAGTPVVRVHNCDNSIGFVYGGGNAAHITNGNTDVTIYGGNKIGTVFGGGNGTVTPANVSGNTNVKIYGGTILKVFGGSNSQGTIGGSINVNVNKQADTDPEGTATACNMIVEEVYGGGNQAASNAGNVSIGCTGTLTEDHSSDPEQIGVTLEGVGTVYGGANQANITGGIELDINGGIVGNVFGGNNTSGNITGGIEVNILKTSACDWYVGNVFGGGNLAQYSGSPEVNVFNGTVSGNVYGGGKGDPADHTKGQVTGNPVVTIGDNNNAHQAIVSGDVYGGGDAGNVVGTPVVNVVNKCNTEVNYVYGGGNAADVSATDVNIDGGTIANVFGGGHGDRNAEPQKIANVGGDVDVTVTGGTIGRVFGGSNSKGTISGDISLTIEKANTSCPMHITEVYGGGNEAEGNAGEINVVCTGGDDEGIEYVYGGANQADVTSDITLNITGGRITRGVFGGNNTSGNISGTITVNVTWNNGCAENYLYDVFGGGNLAPYSAPVGTPNYPAVNINNGTVDHNVYGGGKGGSAVVTGNPVVTIGDANASHAAIVHGDVYGGGDAAAVTGNTTVTYNDNNGTSNVNNLFGGGNAAGVSGTSTVTLTNGNVTTGIYGGCNSSGTIGGIVAVNINGGIVGAAGDGSEAYGIFGGGYGERTSTGDAVTVTIGNGTTTPTIYGDVYGGSAKGDVNDAIGELTKVWLRSGTVNGDIYGGGFGDGGANALVNGQVQVVIDGGRVNQNNGEHGCVFGCNNENGTPKGAVSVTINNTAATIINAGVKTYALQGVYGGGNLAAYNPTTPQAPTVVVDNCGSSIKDLYGGGNAAPVPATDVTINGGDIDRAFAGGNGESGTPAHVGYNSTATSPDNGTSYGTGIATILVTDGTVNKVFGGSNANGIIRTSANVNVERGGTSCGLHIGELYGGGNKADGKAGLISIGCTGGADEGIEYVYGGANQADVTGDITLNITGGRITRGVFGGNNTSGNISGDIIVNVEWNGSCAQNYLYDVFGGGRDAAYTNAGSFPQVNIKNGTVSHNVYGGGQGAMADVTGNPVVTIGDLTAGHESYVATVTGEVYGGGDAAAVTGHTLVTVQKANSAVGTVYGGGNAAGITGYTVVDINNGTVGSIYGGGNAAGVSTTTVNVNNGTVSTGVYGGCNSTGTITGNIEVNINGGTLMLSEGIFGGGEGAGTATSGNVTVNIGNAAGTYTPAVIGDVYGGSALGSVNDAAADATIVNILSGSVTGNIYGGGMGLANVVNGSGVITTDNSDKGRVFGSVTVNVGTYTGTLDNPTLIGNATIHGMVFGGNNTNGSPQDNVFVYVFKTAHVSGDGISTGNVYPSTLKAQAPETDELDEADMAALTDGQRTSLWAAERFAIDAVYGGGNQASYTATGKKASVVVYGCEENTVQYVYGGCRGGAAGVVSSTETDVVINGGHIRYVFGGGDGSGAGNKGANVLGDASVVIKGGLIDAVFGGSNTLGVVNGTSTVDFDFGEVCDYLIVNSVYGGGNLAPSAGTIVVNIPCGTMGLKDVYGGANQANHNGSVQLNIFGGSMERAFGGSKNANITGDVTVNVFGGSIDQLYGGNNEGGLIGGKITVNVDHNNTQTCTDPIALNRIYGGGRNAAYTPGSPYGPASNLASTPEVNIIHDSLTLYVFGGGYGSTARITGNPQVNLGADRPSAWTALGWTKKDAEIGDLVHIHNDVYGGGEAAPVTGNTRVHLRSQSGTPDNTTTVDGSIFGGGLGHTATIDFRRTTLEERKADTLLSGAHRGWPYTGNTEVDIRGDRTLVVGSVYGGGNAGIVYGNTDVIIGDYVPKVVTPAITFSHTWTGSDYEHTAQIVTTTNDADLYYTDDGSDPDEGSSDYSAPFNVTPGSIVKAIGIRDGYTNSDVTSVEYRPKSHMPVISYIRDGANIRAVLTTPAGDNDRTWYRLGGSDPDEGNRTVYNSANKPIVTVGDEIRAYSLGMNDAGWDLSNVASSTVAAVETPVVTVDDNGRVSITCATPGATIRYNYGAAPVADVTEGSILWNGTRYLSKDQHIKVVAYKDGMVYSEQAEAVYNAVTATPVITFGRQDADVVADIACATYGVTLIYRIGGSDPDPANIDEVDTKTFDVDHRPVVTDGQVIKAMAIMDGRNNSAVATATAQIATVPTLTVSPTGQVTLTPAPGTTARYTTDGNEPDEASTEYTAPFQAANFATIKAIGTRDGFTSSETVSERYVPTVATPTITFQRNGTTIKPLIECTTPGSEIYWSTDGVDPTDGSLRYFPASASVASGVTIKARAYCAYPYDWNPSAVLTAVVTDAVATPVITVSDDGTSVTDISCATGGATIRYTTGETPVTEESPVYGGGTVSDLNNTTFNAAAFKDGLIVSITSVKRPVATPVIAISNTGHVTITCATAGATIRYTTAGYDPAYNYGTEYEGTFGAVAPGTVIKAVAFKDGEIISGVATATRGDIGAPTISVNQSSRYITLVPPARDGVVLRYTTDGTDPGISASAYTYQFRMPGATIKAVSVLGGNLSPIATIEPVATPTPSRVGTTVTITCTTPGATIYYTTDGSSPTTSSNVYTGPFNATIGDLITAYAVKDGMNVSENSTQLNVTAD